MLTLVATLEFGYFLGLCLPALSKSVYFKCQIGPLHYDCTGHPGQFYVLLCKYITEILIRTAASKISINHFRFNFFYSSVFYGFDNGGVFGMLRFEFDLDGGIYQILWNVSDDGRINEETEIDAENGSSKR